MTDKNEEIISVWDENKIRADELIKDLTLCSIPVAVISIKYNVITEYPAKSEIKETDAVFLSFESDDNSVSEAADISAFIKLNNKSCLLVLISDKNINFNVFFRPSISPCGVICRPFTLEYLKQIFEEVIDELQRLQKNADSTDKNNATFDIKTGGNYYSFFCKDILFFEAQTKKVAVKTFGQEVLFYDSIESISENLPAYFIRCHRSYIVNANHIKSAHFGDMTICLKDNSKIPMSRSYKSDVRQVVEK